MMPFSVFRTLLTSLLSWALLGLGIYLGYLAYEDFGRDYDELGVASIPDRAIDERSSPQLFETAGEVAIDGEVVVLEHDRKDWRPWAELVGALLCLGLCMGGRLPVRFFLSSKDGNMTSVPHPTSTFVVSRPDGSQLHGEVYENAGKPSLLLTHGWSLDSSAWKYMIESLRSRYRLVTWDLAGLGKSKGPSNGDYSLEKLSGDLNAVLEHTVGDGQVIMIGHSIGGMIQQTFCRMHADKLKNSVKGLVLLHTTYINPVRTNMAAWITKPLEPIIKLINLSMIPFAPLIWLSNWQSYFNGSSHLFARLESFTGKQTWPQLDHSAFMGAKAWPSVVARGNFGMMKFDEERTLSHVNVPVLVVSGEHDRLTLQSASEHIETRLPDARPFCDHGGHLGHWEHNDKVSGSILEFAEIVFKNSEKNIPSDFALPGSAVIR